MKRKTLAEEIGKKNPFDSLKQETVLNLARTYSMLAADLANLLKSHGITGPQYNVLRILRGHGEPVSVYQISNEMISTLPDMPRLIDRLKAAELVEKNRCEKDRRVVWVTLTAKGAAVLKEIDQPLIALHQTQFQHLSQDQLKTLNELLVVVRNRP